MSGTAWKTYLFEIFILVRHCGMFTTSIATNFLVQDKFCRIVYNESQYLCQRINDLKPEELSGFKSRDAILASSAGFTQLQFLIEFVPMLVWSLFVGSFLDKNRNSTKWLLILQIVVELVKYIIYGINEYFFELSPYYMLLGSIPLCFSGGMTTFLATGYRFVMVISSEKTRPIRLMLFQFGIIGGMSLGSFLGGLLLTSKSLADVHQSGLRNYWHNYIVAFGIDTLSLIPLWLVANYAEKLPRSKQIQEECEIQVQSDSCSNALEKREEHSGKKTVTDCTSAVNVTVENKNKNNNLFGDLFDIKNVRETVTCLFKKRSNNVNVEIYTIFSLYFIVFFIHFGMISISLQFCEKVYGWNSSKYSNASSIGQIVSTLSVSIAVVVFIKKLQIRDFILIVATLATACFSQILIGTFLTGLMYFAAMPLTAMSNVTFVCIRNKLSRIISEDEYGKIFSMLATIESCIPLLSSITYSNMFAAVISTYPGLVYHFNAFLYFVTISINVANQYYCKSF